MKKLLSMMLVMLMVVSVCAPASLIASAETIDDSLIFSLSFSQGDSGVTFADAVSTTTRFVIGDAASLSVGTVEGKTTKYLQTTQGVAKSGVYVNVKSYQDAIKAAMKDDVSVEMWTKAPETPSGMAFSYWGYTEGTSQAYNMAFQYEASSGVTVFSANTNATAGRIATVTGTTEANWNHWVITRNYDSAGTG